MWHVHFSPLAKTSTSDAYVEGKPSTAATIVFTILCTCIHVAYMIVLHEVSRRIPVPVYALQVGHIEVSVGKKPVFPVIPVVSTAARARTDVIIESAPKIGKLKKKQTIEDIFLANTDAYKGLSWYRRMPMEAVRGTSTFVNSVREVGVYEALYKYMTFSHYGIRYYVKSRLQAKTGTLEEFGDDSDIDDEDDEGDTANVISGGLTQMRNPKQLHDYISNFLRFWLAFTGVISMVLYFCFFWNLLVEFGIKCVVDLSKGSWIGFFALFFVLQVVMWFTKRVWDSVKLMWYNSGDAMRVKGVFYWRLSLFLLCLIFTLIQASATDNISVSDNLFWQVMLRQMVLVGMWWGALFVICCIAADAYSFYSILYDTPANVTLPQTIKAMREMTWWQLCFLQRDDSEERNTYRVFKRVMLSTVLVVSVVCFILGVSLKPSEGKPIIFVALILFWYYVQVFGRRAKWKALFVLWSATGEYTHFDHDHNNKTIHRRHTRAVTKGGNGLFDKSAENKAFDDKETEVFYDFPPGFMQKWVKPNKQSALAKRVRDKINRQLGIKTSVVSMVALNQLQSADTTTEELKAANGGLAVVCDEQTKVEDAEESEFYEESWSSSFEDLEQLQYDLETGVKKVDKRRSMMKKMRKVKSMRRLRGFSQAKDEFKEEIVPLADVGLPGWIAVFFGDGNAKTIRISWMEYWNTVDTVDNDYLGYGNLVNGSCECCAIFVMLVVSAMFLLWAAKAGKVDTTKAAESDMAAEYALCRLQTHDDLTLMDMVFFTEAAYHIFRDEERLFQQMEVWFGNDTWDMWNKSSMFYQATQPSFFAFDRADVEAAVVAVRGTKTFSDVLQDISLYSEVAVLQSISYVIPLTKLLPVGFLRDWVWLAAKPEGMIDPKVRSKFDEPVDDFVKNKFDENPNRTLTIAGHSLGGAIAQIVAARMVKRRQTNNVFSFGVSSPGTIYTSAKFGFPVEALDKSSLSVLPRRDPISLGDLHGGLVQMIECDAITAMQCHSSTRSFCELYANCGRESVRNQTLADCVCHLEDSTWDGCMGFTEDWGK